jgi:hypothetical protein
MSGRRYKTEVPVNLQKIRVPTYCFQTNHVWCSILLHQVLQQGPDVAFFSLLHACTKCMYKDPVFIVRKLLVNNGGNNITIIHRFEDMTLDSVGCPGRFARFQQAMQEIFSLLVSLFKGSHFCRCCLCSECFVALCQRICLDGNVVEVFVVISRKQWRVVRIWYVGQYVQI